MRILFIDTSSSGTIYYRMRQFMEPLKRRGHQVAMLDWTPDGIYSSGWQNAPNSPAISRRLGMLVASSDVVISQTCQTPGALRVVVECADHFGKPLLTEVDDNVLAVQPDQPAYVDYHHSHPRLDLIKRQLAVSRAIVTPSEFLGEIYSEFNPNVHLVPNAIDPAQWPKTVRLTPAPPTIGWQGGASHHRDLLTIRPVIEKLTAEMDARWVFVGGVPNWLKDTTNIEYDPTWVAVEKWPAKLMDQKIDIGLAPLADNPFSRGKSDLRFIEYAAAGIATVAQESRPYQTIQDGVTGCIYHNAEELESILRRWIAQPGNVDNFKRAARDWVMNNRTADHSAAIYEAALEGYCG